MDKESFFNITRWSNTAGRDQIYRRALLNMITPERIWSPLNTSIFYYFISWYITWLWDSLRFFDILYLT